MLAEHLATVNPTMAHDPDERPPAPEAPAAFDFNTRPRWRSKLFPATDGPPAESAPQKPVPAPARETTPEGATPKPEGAAVLDLDRLPRVRPAFMLTPDDPPGKPTPQEPTPAQAGETVSEFDPNILPRVRPAFRITTNKPWAESTLQKPAPAPSPRKTTGKDWRAQTLAERANKPPPRAEEPARESESALRAFLDTGEAETENRSAKDDEDQPG